MSDEHNIPNKKTKVRRILVKYSILMITFFVSFLSIFNYWYSTNMLINSTKSLNDSLLYTIYENLKEIFNETDTLYRLISENDEVIDAMEAMLQATDSSDRVQKYKSRNAIMPVIYEVSNYNTDILDELIIFINDEFFASKGELGTEINKNKYLYKYLKDLGSRDVELLRLEFSSSYINKQSEKYNNSYLLVRHIYSKNNTYIGKAIFFLDQDLMNKLMKQNNFTIIDSNNQIIIRCEDQTIDISEDSINNWLNQNNSNYFNIINNNEYFVNYTDMDMYDWKMINFVSADSFRKGMTNIREYTLIIVLLAYGLAIGLIYLLSNKFTKRLKELVETINSFPSVAKNKSKTIDFKGKYGSRVSFQRKIQVFFCIIALTPMILISITNYISIDMLIKKQNIQIVNSILISKTDRMNNLMDRYNRITKYIVTNPIIQEYFGNHAKGYENGVYLNIKEEITKEYVKVFDDSDFFHEIQLRNVKGELIYSTNLLNCTNSDNSASNEINIVPFWNLSNDLNSRIRTIEILRSSIGLKVNGGNYIGDCNLVIKEAVISNIFNNDKFNEKNLPLDYFVLNQENQIMSSNRKSQIGFTFENLVSKESDKKVSGINNKEMNKVQLMSDLDYFGWKIVYVYDTEGISKSSLKLIYFDLFFIVLCVFFVMAISNRKLLYLSGFFYEVNSGLEQLVTSNFKIQINRNKGDELDYLADGFNRMAEKLDTLVQEVYKSKLKEKELELRSLQLQINPHFLYNTLENINALIDLNDERASYMIQLLSEFFRSGVSRGNNKYRIKDEIEYTKVYIEIQKIRFGNRLDITWNYNESILDFYTLNFMLQPIIENSIKHGLSKINRVGNIKICIYKASGKVKFIIKDNGVGMDEEKLNQIKRMLTGETNTGGIGIYNVHERIKLYYGLDYGMSVYSKYGKGTSFVITIPIISDVVKIDENKKTE